MSVIANFQKYYKDTDPALDLFDVIVSIYKWFYRNMWERRVQYMQTGKVIPIATSDFPGQDFGFMPMEAVFYTRSCFRTMYSNKKSAAISSEGCVIQLPDSVSEELSLTNAYSILWMGNQTHCTIPIAVNNEWGDVLYATCPIMPAEDGSTFMLDKSCSVYSLYDFSKIIIVSTLSAERRVLYNAVAGVYEKKYVDVPVDNDTADKDPSENVDTSKGSTDLPDSSSENTDSNDEDDSSEKNNSENTNTSTDEEVALPPEQEELTAQQVG